MKRDVIGSSESTQRACIPHLLMLMLKSKLPGKRLAGKTQHGHAMKDPQLQFDRKFSTQPAFECAKFGGPCLSTHRHCLFLVGYAIDYQDVLLRF